MSSLPIYEVVEIETLELTSKEDLYPVYDCDDEPQCPHCGGMLQWQGKRVDYQCLNCLRELPL